MQTFAMVLIYVNSLAVLPGYGSRAECDAASRLTVEIARQDGRKLYAYCVPGPVEVR